MATGLTAVPVRWRGKIAAAGGATVELTSRYRLERESKGRAVQRARRRMEGLLGAVGAAEFSVGTATVTDTALDGGWYLAVEDDGGRLHWVRGRGLASLSEHQYSDVTVYSGLCLGGTGTILGSSQRVSAYEDAVSSATVALAGAFRRTSAAVGPVADWDLPELHYLLSQLDQSGRPTMRPVEWAQWKRAVAQRATLVRRLLWERSEAVGLTVRFPSSLAALADTVHGQTPGRTPTEALKVLAGADPAWAVAAAVRTVDSYHQLGLLAYAVEALRACSPDLHGQPDRLALVIEDPAEERILSEAHRIAKDAGLSFAAAGLYTLPDLLPSSGVSLYACGCSEVGLGAGWCGFHPGEDAGQCLFGHREMDGAVA